MGAQQPDSSGRAVGLCHQLPPYGAQPHLIRARRAGAGECLHEAARSGGTDAEALDQGLRQLGGVAQGPHPAVGHLHAALLDRLGRGGGAQPVGADV